MDLFNNNNETNLLPYDGEVIYYGHILSESEAWHYYDILLNEIAWQNDEAIIFGKRIITKRKVAWYGNENYSYTYSGTTKTALPWTKALMELKDLTEKTCGSKFNSCLLNLYHDGDEGMAWHSDDEKSLGKNTVIGSLSFGAVRKFSFKHKETSQKIDTILDNGSLLVMKGETQTNWLHRLPPSTKIKHPRINLTFRTIVTNTP
ncbi:alpha-ketoglutarate-dependent dioxygenase AlkB family protein [Flavobacterium sp. AG291]|uniref:alpha-ketoglutarate-dependent dioxygenase AlkB family protein n=1 Tax=Flavobacterium sp. AG291 TaxID=2184000 RepID=UPI000E0A63A3|nr:alpha-ketoglutarate-dependent dioxygenase AlkB [Flavobacterium sp. AG291]RDI06946.1 alkylated DNA repair dioxygenase AlkB [Flavobacterium sp. AG291]